MSDVLAPIEPVRRTTLGAMVTDRLRELVIHGRFAPGTPLNEVELANRFGVSRGPIREALQHLLQEGLLRRDARRGITVPVVSDADVADLYLARQAIETAAIRVVVAQRQGSALAHELGQIVHGMSRAADSGDWAAVADLDMAFHARIVDAAGSPRLSRIHAGIIDETRACFSMIARYPGREDLVAEHSELAGLIERGDLERLLAELDRHLMQSVATVNAHRQVPDAEPAEPRPTSQPERPQ